MLGVARHRHPPVEGGARDREVLEPRPDEADHLVAALRRADEVLALLVEPEQPVLIGREAEEIGLLLVPLDRRAERLPPDTVVADDGFLLVEIRLLAHRVPAAVAVEIDVAILRHRLPDGLAGALVPRFGGANELIVRGAQRLHHGPKDRRVAVGKLDRGQALLLGGLLHLKAVLVRSGEEEHALAVEPLEAGQRVGGDHRVGVADMRLAVRIENRRRDVEKVAGHGKAV
jgi:hypothetical protein